MAMGQPRWFTVAGLYLDLVGGVLIAATAWLRMSVFVGYGGPGSEYPGPLWWRRMLVLLGGLLLTAGFGLQIYGTQLQIALAAQ